MIMMMGALVVEVVDSKMVPCECCGCDVVVDLSFFYYCYRISLSLSLLQTKLHPVTRLCVYVFCYIQVPHFRRWLCVLVMLCALTTMYSPNESTAPSHTFARCRPDSFRYGTATHVCCQRPVPTNRAKSSGVTEWVA